MAHAGAGPPMVSRLQRRPSPVLAWRQVQSQGDLPGPRSGAASAVVGDKLYMFGGYGGSGRLDDFFEFDFETRVWSRVEATGSGPGQRENNGVVEYEGKLYLFGGYNGTTWLNDFHQFDLVQRKWRLIDPANPAPAARFGYVSAVHAHSFVLFGGYDGQQWLNDMHRYDFRTRIWALANVTGHPPSARSCPCWCSLNGSVYVFGGYDGERRMNDLFRCDLNRHEWTQLPCLGEPPSPRYFHASAVHDGKMYTFGGYNGTERLNDMHEYDLTTHTWRTLQLRGDVPSGRSSLVAQVHENSLYIFGGYNGQIVLNDYYEYRFEPVAIPPSSLVADLRSLINNKDVSDVTFIVDDQPVHATRAHLAVRSDHFRAMLYGGMREAQAQEIRIHDVRYDVFMKLLEYLYTDQVEDLPTDTAVPLLIAAEQYLLDRLKNICEDSIRKNIAVQNVISIFMAAHRHRAQGLREIGIEFILAHLEEVKRTKGFLALKDEPELLMEIIMRQETLP